MSKKFSLFSMLICATLLAVAILPTGAAFAATGPVTSNVAVTAVTPPLTIGGSATLTATEDDTASGGFNIVSAQYSLNGGAWTAMTASDGAFDSPTEDVTASFTVAQGLNEVCVTGTDSGGFTGAAVCTTFTAASSTYTFKGFYPPVRNNATNVRKAGSNLPVKWSLMLIAGGPAASSSFVAVESFAVDCATGIGDFTTAVKESGPGKSGLQSQNGSFHFNWKTPKSYSGTCRDMYVLFDDGSVSPLVLFKFK
jgi:hypothetical protein